MRFDARDRGLDVGRGEARRSDGWRAARPASAAGRAAHRAERRSPARRPRCDRGGETVARLPATGEAIDFSERRPRAAGAPLRRGRRPPRSAAIGRVRRRAESRRVGPCRRPPRSTSNGSSCGRRRRTQDRPYRGESRDSGHSRQDEPNHQEPRKRPENRGGHLSAPLAQNPGKVSAKTLARHGPGAVRLLAADALAAVRPPGNVDGLRIGATAAAGLGPGFDKAEDAVRAAP